MLIPETIFGLNTYHKSQVSESQQSKLPLPASKRDLSVANKKHKKEVVIKGKKANQILENDKSYNEEEDEEDLELSKTDEIEYGVYRSTQDRRRRQIVPSSTSPYPLSHSFFPNFPQKRNGRTQMRSPLINLET